MESQSGKLRTATGRPKELLLYIDSDDFSGSQSDSTTFEDKDNRYPVGKNSPRKGKGLDRTDESSACLLKKQRTKSRKTSNSSKGTKGKKCGRLAVLLSMPLDILFEIIGQLRPIDLLQLTRANKALKNILMAKSGDPLWRAARRNIPAFPETPGDMLEAEWVHLIFETNCHAPGCKKKGIRKIDWALRIRGCERCWKANIVLSGRFAQHFPELEPEIMQLLPYSNTGGWAYRYLSNNRFYWRPAILALSKTLDEYNKNIKLRKPGAEAALSAFMDAQAARAATVVKYASVCKAWESDTADNRKKALQNLCDNRIHEVSARFINLGWSSEYVEELKRHSLVRQSKELTERVWVNIRPQLETEMQKRRHSRRRTDIYILFEDHLVKTWGEGLRNLFWGIIDMIDIGSLKDMVNWMEPTTLLPTN